MQFRVKTSRNKSKVLTVCQWHLTHTLDEQKKTERSEMCA